VLAEKRKWEKNATRNRSGNLDIRVQTWRKPVTYLMDFARALGISLIRKRPPIGIAIVAGGRGKGGQVNSGAGDTRRGAEAGFNWPQLTMRLIRISKRASSSHFYDVSYALWQF